MKQKELTKTFIMNKKNTFGLHGFSMARVKLSASNIYVWTIYHSCNQCIALTDVDYSHDSSQFLFVLSLV